MLGAERSSANMKVLGALVADSIRFAAARGELAVLVRARKGWEVRVSRCVYEAGDRVGTYCQGVHRFHLLHLDRMSWSVVVTLW